ncbi:MAG TPA: hypothetical protein VFA18_12105 [Gemmataceae bacterium]|nr:hypothetical protein [Gemmataceae bacterium]
MSQAIQAKCPGCGKTLRVPAEWLGRTLRCKHCGTTVEARRREKASTPPPAPAVTPPVAAPVSAPVPAVENNPHPFAFDLPDPAAPRTESGSAPSGELGITLPHYYRRRRRSHWHTAIVAVIVLGLAGAAVTTFFRAGGADRLRQQLAGQPEKNATPPVRPIPKTPAPYPRRMLVIGISNYWYANPVAYGDEERSLDRLAQKLDEAWRVPREQRAVLTDGGPNPIAPTGDVIKKTITDYFDTSRPQDRIVLMFVGHAAVMDKDSYLVPIDGDFKVKDSLIPLRWLYDGLAKCKARQKLFIADLCRYDPGRGLERPGSKPMDQTLAEQLRHPPAGVQVWSACSANEYSYEGQTYLGDGTPRHAGFFMNGVYEAIGPAEKLRIRQKAASPDDPLPLELFAQGGGQVPGIFAETTQEVKEWLNLTQTPFAAGSEAAGGAPYDPDAPPLAALVIQKRIPPPGKAVADPRLIQAILHETGEDIYRAGSPAWNVATMPFFDASLAENYKDDGKTTPLRDAVRQALRLLKKHAANFEEEFRGNANAAVKKAVRMKQRLPARAMLEIEAALAKLESAKSEKPREKSKRWKANADFVTAKLQARLVYIYQYDLMLAKILKDQVPQPKKGKSSGARLAAEEKLDVQSGLEWRKRAEDARKAFLKIARTYKGTPWEFLARREAVTALGLSWQPMP